MAAFSIVDVFNTTAFKGNPLAVVENQDGKLTKMQMQLIARQFNLSETTFVCSDTQGDAPIRLRSFLPNGREVLGIGHNILGAWWQLAASGKLDLSEARRIEETTEAETFAFQQRLGEEISSVFIARRKADAEVSVVIRQVPPQLHAVHPEIGSLAASVGLSEEDIGGEDPGRLLPQVASTSTTRHLLVPVRSLDALNRVNVDREKLLHQLSLVDEKAFGIYFFTRSTEKAGQYVARFFSPGMSGEDPATGSAAGPLSRYLYEHGSLEVRNGQGNIQVVQGLQVGRNCIIDVDLTVSKHGDEEKVDFDLSGSGVGVADGVIAVPEAGLQF